MKNYYEILGIEKSANADEIKRAYRKLASKHHPDKGGDTAVFQEIQTAYDTLSDPAKKQQYDLGGTGSQQNFDPRNFGFHFGGFGPFGPAQGDPFQDLRDFFGNGAHRAPRKNQDIVISHPVTLFDSLTGKKETIQYRTAAGTATTLDIEIPPAVNFGYRVRYGGYGDDSVQGLPRGDLILDIKMVLPHNYWIEHGNILHTRIEIGVWQAMTGGDHYFTSFDGKQFKIAIPAGTQPTTKFKLRGQGMMVNRTQRGDLCLVAEINIPAVTDSERVSIIDNLSKPNIS
jgi:DnaJ-class molecular chaperone